jgi:hypothetical protein
MMPREKIKEVEKTEYQFFGEADLNRRGEVSSQVPAYMLTQLVEDLKQQVVTHEKELEDTSMQPEVRGKLMSKLREEKERLHMIEDSKPKLNKDIIAGVVGKDRNGGSLGEKIAESMFTYTDMQKGLADAHEEARRMSEPIIPLRDKEMDIAKGCNVRIGKDGMVSRDDAIRVWKIGRKYLGENSNAEILRRG